MHRPIFYLIIVCFTILYYITATRTAIGQNDQAGKVNGSDSSYVRGITPGRAKSLTGGVLALASVIISLLVRKKSAANTSRRHAWSITSMTLGIIAIAFSILHLANTKGGFGTGGGKAGAIIALLLGL